MELNANTEIPYTPMQSLGHELGILFGFVAACLLIMAIYIYFWRAAEHRENLREQTRRQEFDHRNPQYKRQGVFEKMTDREILYPRNRVELPGRESQDRVGVEMTVL